MTIMEVKVVFDLGGGFENHWGGGRAGKCVPAAAAPAVSAAETIFRAS